MRALTHWVREYFVRMKRNPFRILPGNQREVGKLYPLITKKPIQISTPEQQQVLLNALGLLMPMGIVEQMVLTASSVLSAARLQTLNSDNRVVLCYYAGRWFSGSHNQLQMIFRFIVVINQEAIIKLSLSTVRAWCFHSVEMKHPNRNLSSADPEKKIPGGLEIWSHSQYSQSILRQDSNSGTAVTGL